jgi:hypothetical protein
MGYGNEKSPQKSRLYNILARSHKDTILKGVKDWVYLFKEYPVL